jgi:hypothetical protein
MTALDVAQVAVLKDGMDATGDLTEGELQPLAVTQPGAAGHRVMD